MDEILEELETEANKEYAQSKLAEAELIRGETYEGLQDLMDFVHVDLPSFEDYLQDLRDRVEELEKDI